MNDPAEHSIEFVLRDPELAAELPIVAPLTAPLSFQIQADQEPTLTQLTEILEKMDYSATTITPSSDVLERNLREYVFGGVCAPGVAERVGRLLGLASVFDAAVLGCLENWEMLLRAAHAAAVPLVGGCGFEPTGDAETSRPSAAEIARQIQRLLAKDVAVAVIPGAAASVPAHTVDQKSACRIIKASDSTLRRGGYFNDQATAGHDPAKLNGVLVGREWRFEVREVNRFADFYWGQKKAVGDGPGPAIRGRDI